MCLQNLFTLIFLVDQFMIRSDLLTHKQQCGKPTFRHHHDAIIKTNLQIMRDVKYIGLSFLFLSAIHMYNFALAKWLEEKPLSPREDLLLSHNHHTVTDTFQPVC